MMLTNSIFTLSTLSIQQIDKVTHGTEILDLVFTNNQELISNLEVTEWTQFTDHKFIIASVTYQDQLNESEQEETHLLDVGRRFGKLNFNKAPWEQIKNELGQVDWTPMEELSKVSPKEALSWFNDKILQILENLVPAKKAGRKKAIPRMCRQRRLLWSRLAKVKKNIRSASTVHKLSKFLHNRWDLESQLRED